MADMHFSLGQPLMLRRLTQEGGKIQVSRVLAVSSQSITVSMPYDSGVMVLWPMSCQLEVSVTYQGKTVSFITEIIGRDFGEVKSYTLAKPVFAAPAVDSQFAGEAARVIAVTSGKGGVGKTALTINLAIALASYGKRIFILDADLGTANVDVLLKLSAKYNIIHLLAGEKNLLEIAVPAPGNISVIPGGSGFQALTNMREGQFRQIINSFNQLDGLADYVLIDTGAGISRDVSTFLAAADEVLVVTTPEPHALTDAYAIMKVMHTLECQSKMNLLVNRVENQREADLVAAKLSGVVDQYLNRQVEYIGFVLEDRLVSRSLKQQKPFMLLDPDSPPSRNIKSVAAKLLKEPATKTEGMSGFIAKLFSFGQKAKKFTTPFA